MLWAAGGKKIKGREKKEKDRDRKKGRKTRKDIRYMTERKRDR